MARMTAEATGVSTQAEHPFHLRNGSDHTGVVACLLRLPRRTLQASNALEQQVTLIDVVVPEGQIQPLVVGISHDMAGVSAGAANVLATRDASSEKPTPWPIFFIAH